MGANPCKNNSQNQPFLQQYPPPPYYYPYNQPPGGQMQQPPMNYPYGIYQPQGPHPLQVYYPPQDGQPQQVPTQGNYHQHKPQRHHAKQVQPSQQVHYQRTDPNRQSDNSFEDLEDDNVKSEESLEDYDFDDEKGTQQQDDVLTLDVDISGENTLVQTELMRLIKNGQSQIDQNVSINHKGNIIKLTGPRDQVEEADLEIQIMLTDIQSRYIQKDLDLNDKEVAYFNQNLLNKKSLIERKENCKIILNQYNNQQQNQSQSQVALQLSYENKCFKIIQGDIQKFKTDAVVNTANQQLTFGNPSMQTGVTKKLQQLGGIRYENACKEYLKKNNQLEYGTVFPHHHNAVLIQYILTTATPFYEQGSKTKQDLQIIRQNIEAVFKTADRLKIKDITFPIIGGGTSGFKLESAATTVIGAVIDGLFKMNTTVISANIIEIDAERIPEILKITNKLINQQPKRQVKYQWQWQDGVFQDYDDQEVNQQIDIAFDEYQLDNTKNSIKLIFAYTKLPGTHLVKFSDNTLTDKNLKTVSKITLGQHQGVSTYFFDNNPVHPKLNEFLFRQSNLKIDQFEIFYKRHRIEFSNNKIQQINEYTNYCREVQYVPYQKPQQSVQGFALSGKLQVDSVFFENNCSIKVIDQKNFDKINKGIKKMIQSNFVQMTFSIPNIENADLDALILMIENDSLDIKGRIAPGQKVSVLINRNMQQYINSHISQSESRKAANDLLRLQSQLSMPTYPKEWSGQQQNFIKVELPVNQKEYQKIQNLFAASDDGKIYKIYRIQNKILWENYAAEKQKLINRYERNGQQLSPKELEHYVWHGVSNQHPSVIYTSEIDAFDSSYSRVKLIQVRMDVYGVLGFISLKKPVTVEHILTIYNLKMMPIIKIKSIFMLLTHNRQFYSFINLGRVLTCNSDGSLRRPPQGFDCVSGVTGLGKTQGTIYVLYQMQVRRAYPAYEVIYE